MRKITLLWAILATLWAISATALIFCNPLPFPDRGHRLYGVRSERDRNLMITILKRSGIQKRWTFDEGPTHQTIFWDGVTVVNRVDQETELSGLNGCGISLPSKSPGDDAYWTQMFLRSHGHFPTVLRIIQPGRVVLVQSDLLEGGCSIIYRLPLSEMGRPHIHKD